MCSLRKHQFLKSSELKTAYFMGKRGNLSELKSVFEGYALKCNTDVCMVRTRMHSFVPFFFQKKQILVFWVECIQEHSFDY